MPQQLGIFGAGTKNPFDNYRCQRGGGGGYFYSAASVSGLRDSV